DTQITATAPASGPGTVDVKVTTPNGPSVVSGADRFTYFSPSAWTPAGPSGAAGLRAVSCATLAFCAAGGGSGTVATSADPMAGAASWTPANVDGAHVLTAVSCATASACVAVDDAGNALTKDALGIWTPTSVDVGHALTGVSCATASSCVAVDDAGNALTGGP